MQNCEAIESARQIRKMHRVAPKLHVARICSAPPIGPCHAKGCLDHRQGQVLLLQEAGPFAGLCLVLALHAETQPRVQRSEPVFEPESRFFGSSSPWLVTLSASLAPWREGGQHVARPTAVETIACVDENQAARDRRPGGVERAATRPRRRSRS